MNAFSTLSRALALAALLAPALAAAQADECVSGTQPSGALYELCVPSGEAPETLVLYAHGFVFPQQPLRLPSAEGGVDVGAFVTGQGLGYAATSYYTNGLIDPERGIEDLRGLIGLYAEAYGEPERVLLFGISNGALLSTLALERFPDAFDGAFASCGPVGSYVREVDYLGDIYVAFDYFFPDALDSLFGVEAGGPTGINPAFLAALFQAAGAAGVGPDLFLGGALQNVLADPANAGRTGQLLGVLAATPSINAAFASPAEGVQTVIRAVIYNVFATNNLIEVLEGSPYENAGRTYASPFGPSFDAALNAQIARYTADADARAELAAEYVTTGDLEDPVVALHTTRDGLVPFWQSALYADKVGDPSLFRLTPIERYGHCAFEPAEVAAAFQDLLRITEAPETVACAPGAPVRFSDFDPDGGDPTYGEFAAVTNGGEGGAAVDLDGCTFLAFDPRTERASYALRSDGRLAPAAVHTFATMNADQSIPTGALPDGPGAVVLAQGSFGTGASVGDVAGSVVAAVVYRADGDVVGSIGGGEADAEALAALLAQLRAVAGEDRPDGALALTVAPNPTAGRAAVSFGLAEGGVVRVSVYDALGREVAVLADGPHGPGRHDLSFEAGPLPSGVYVVRVAGADVRTARLTVAR